MTCTVPITIRQVLPDQNLTHLPERSLPIQAGELARDGRFHPQGVIAIAHGPLPTGIGGPALRVRVLIGVTVPEVKFTA